MGKMKYNVTASDFILQGLNSSIRSMNMALCQIWGRLMKLYHIEKYVGKLELHAVKV